MNDFLGNLTALSWETHGVRLILGWYGLVCGDGRGPWLCQAGAPLGGLGEVLPQVEQVGDLDRVSDAAGGV